jgi:triosephosphate isomerase
MRKKIVAGNWKMNKNYQEGMELVAEAMHMINDELNAKVLTIFASPAIHLASVQKLINGHANFASAAQNCHQENAGAFTGEIAASMIHSVGASYVLIGHSERRQYFKETNELLAKKVDTALANHLHPIFCFGELKEEREAGKHFDVVAQQLKESLFHLSASDDYYSFTFTYQII